MSQSVAKGLGELAARLLGRIAGHEHLAGWTGKSRLAVCKIAARRKAFVATAKIAVFTRCKTSIVVATAETTVIRATGIAVVEA